MLLALVLVWAVVMTVAAFLNRADIWKLEDENIRLRIDLAMADDLATLLKRRIHFIGWPNEATWWDGGQVNGRQVPDWRQEIKFLEAYQERRRAR